MIGDHRAFFQGAAATLSCVVLGWSSSALAQPGKCLLQVNGRTYLDAVCNIDVSATGGSFSIGTGETSREKHFAMVIVEPEKGRGVGYWNGVEGEDRAHEGLGVLVRRGACWSNKRAKICAVRK